VDKVECALIYTNSAPLTWVLTHCRNFGAPTSFPSHGGDKLGCTPAASPMPPVWVPFVFASGIGFAHGEEFGKERSGAFAPCVNNSLVLIEPLFLFPY
jgi:hypothetical protein